MDTTQSYDSELNASKGWFSPYALDKTASVAADSAAITMGSVCSLNANANLQLGLAVNAMPLFAFSQIESYTGDGPAGKVANMAGHMAGRFYVGPNAENIPANRVQGTAATRVLCFVAVGSYELETTQFVAGRYAPNDPLTAPAPDADNEGKLLVGEFYTNTICGIVSDGVATNNYGKSILRFWPVFIPATPASE